MAYSSQWMSVTFLLWFDKICTFPMHVYTCMNYAKRYIQYIFCELKRKLHLQFRRATQHFAKMGWDGAVSTRRRRCELRCVHVHVCNIQLSVVSIYACMCKCSPCSKGRCVSHPWGHQSGRESNSSQGHTWRRGAEKQNIMLERSDSSCLRVLSSVFGCR